MVVQDGIGYAGEQEKPLKVIGIRPLADHKLWIRFSTGEIKLFDFTPLLDAPAFQAMKNADAWGSVYIDYGVPVWMDGNVDLAPEYLYEHGVPLPEKETA